MSPNWETIINVNFSNLKNLLFVGLIFLILPNLFAQTPIANINSIPAAVNGVITICQGQTINFASSSSGTAVGTSFVWNFGGGLPANTNSKTAAPTTSSAQTKNTNKTAERN
jgi:hypothetical protein